MKMRAAGSLTDVLQLAERGRHTVTAYAPTVPANLSRHFETEHVTFRHVPVDVSPPSVVVAEEDEVRSVLRLDTVEAFATAESERADTEDRGHREFLSGFSEMALAGLGRRQLLTISREFEDCAFQAGEGTVHAGFQSLSTFRDRMDDYQRLGERGLDVHVYGTPDWAPPYVPGVTVHPERAPEVGRSWFVAYDGADDQCALLAEEVDVDRYRAIWTEEPALVDCLQEYLTREYGTGSAEQPTGETA